MTGQEPALKNFARAGGQQRRQTLGICAGLVIIIFLVFGQTLQHSFVNFDDNAYVYDNPMVARGLSWNGIAWAFTSVHSSNWHPLTWISHMLDCQMYGTAPGGHHLTNVLLHCATAISLFLALRKLTGAQWPSAFVAAVFAIHPLRVESVAWVSERKDVLSGLFFMLTLAAYAVYAQRPRSILRYGLVLLSFAIGLLCKQMLVSLPVVLLLLDFWPLRREESAKKLLLEKIPFIALAAAGCAATLLAQSKAGAIHSGGMFSLAYRIENAFVSCLVYLGQMVWPTKLAVLYPPPPDGQPIWKVILSALLLTGISIGAWLERKTRPWLLTGWIWYLVMLLPIIGIIQVGRQAYADRFTYLPQIGIYIALAWSLAEWRAGRVLLGVASAGVLSLLMVCAWKQTTYWDNSETLWKHTLACTTDNDVAHDNLGDAYMRAGRVDDALYEFQTAQEIRPENTDAHFNYGVALAQIGKIDDAIRQYQEVLRLRPRHAEAHFHLGDLLRQKGLIDGAINQYEEALKTKPNYVEARNNLGTALRQREDIDGAIAQYNQALAIMPDNESIHVNLANAWLQKGRADLAVSQFETALQLDPSDLEVNNNLAWLLATSPQASLRNGQRALQLAQRANELARNSNPIVLGTLAATLAETGQFNEAAQTAQQAIDLARSASQQDLAKRLEGELQLYKSNHPFHHP